MSRIDKTYLAAEIAFEAAWTFALAGGSPLPTSILASAAEVGWLAGPDETNEAADDDDSDGDSCLFKMLTISVCKITQVNSRINH